jgi:hypothetical protein
LTTTIEETTRSTHQEINFSLLSWCLSVIPALGKLRQEDHESKTNMGYTVRPYLKKKRKKKNSMGWKSSSSGRVPALQV